MDITHVKERRLDLIGLLINGFKRDLNCFAHS